MEISLDLVVNVLRKSLVIILIAALIAGVGAYFVSEFLINPTYTSTARINIIGKLDPQSLTESNNSFSFALKLGETCTSILDSHDFFLAVKDDVGLDYLPKLSFRYIDNTTVLVISAVDNDPEVACMIAQSAMRLANTRISQTTSTQISFAEVESPRVPTAPTNPNPVRNAILAFVIVAVLVLCVQLFREMFDTRIREEDELIERYQLPIMAAIPDFNDNSKRNYYYETISYSRGENDGK
ncbi:MAG: hypothetical protein IKB86_06690 [Clostridia bacterium]|nr:hypothetical protein [Clostridia bacterium]